jgi:hypothetical protein
MTAPAHATDAALARLPALAAWDVPLLRGAVVTLAAVAERLTVWRMRLGALARTLQDAECWSGPAAQNAAAYVVEISTVAAAVDSAMVESLAGFERMAGQADPAQELAVEALRASPSAGLAAAVDLHARLGELLGRLAPGARAPGPDPGLDRGTVLAIAALEHAASASAAAVAAEEAVAGLRGVGTGPSATFGDLATAVEFVGPVLLPPVPVSSSPPDAAAWWAGLSLADQLALVRSAPAAVGALDGLPAWARDRANRLLLARALGDPTTSPEVALTARAVSRRIAAEETGGQPVQLQLLDLAGDRVVLALGDLDTADAVALLVPGVGNSPGDDLVHLTGDAEDVAAAARAAAPGLAVATAVWLGYRPPGNLVVAATGRGRATSGGAALARELGGLSAARDAAGARPARTTVLAHSYGTVVVDEAADVPGRLAADAVVLLGSPGMEDDARALEVPEVFDAAAPSDLVADLGYFGHMTDGQQFGATELPVDVWTGHSGYYDPGRPTLAAMGEVVAGVRTTD